jgi:hypothetical protein
VSLSMCRALTHIDAMPPNRRSAIRLPETAHSEQVVRCAREG